MKPEAQRIAIAKAYPNVIRKSIDGANGNEYWEWFDGTEWLDCVDDDLLLDLNAIHEVERRVPDLGLYVIELGRAVDRAQGPQKDHNFAIVTAPAAQRVEAVLRTIGAW